MRTTQRLIVGLAAGTSLPFVAALALLAAFSGLGCPTHPPAPPPVTPDAADASALNPEPGPVPAGSATKCAAACRHADQVCDGSLSGCARACARAGGADLTFIPCVNGAQGCSDLSACDPLARARSIGR